MFFPRSLSKEWWKERQRSSAKNPFQECVHFEGIDFLSLCSLDDTSCHSLLFSFLLLHLSLSLSLSLSFPLPRSLDSRSIWFTCNEDKTVRKEDPFYNCSLLSLPIFLSLSLLSLSLSLFAFVFFHFWYFVHFPCFSLISPAKRSENDRTHASEWERKGETVITASGEFLGAKRRGKGWMGKRKLG